DAIRCFSQAIKYDPKHAESYFGRGSCYDALDHPRKALEDYDAALAINNKNSELWYAKADALYNLGKLPEALLAYKMVLELSPKDFEAWFDYAETLLDERRLTEAARAYESATAIEPEWADAHYGRSKALYLLGAHLESAVELLISFRLDETKKKNFESEFPILGSEDTFKQLEEIVNREVLEAKE
ncbi:MAG: tetratricopeptide repeat protein, partial [Ignavibacteriota bacterium]